MLDKEKIQGLYWWAQDRVRGFQTGLHRSPDFGYSVEFAQHRAYVPGDSPKHVDWAVLAKTDRYLTKQYEAESNLRSYFVVDSSSSLNFPEGPGNKWSVLLELLALAGVLLQSQRDAMGLLELYAGQEHFFEAKVDEQWTLRMLAHLHDIAQPLQGRENGALAATLYHLGARIPKRSQVIIFTDAFIEQPEAVAQSAAQLSYMGHDVRWAVLYSDLYEFQARGLSGQSVVDQETGARHYLSSDDALRFASFVKSQVNSMTEAGKNKGIATLGLNTDLDPLLLLYQLLEPPLASLRK